MNPYDYQDEYFEPSEYDQQVEEFKQTLKDSVRADIQKELKHLRASNAEMSEKLRDLNKLTREAEVAKLRYEREIESAKTTAKADVMRESAEELLRVLSAPAYRVTSEWVYDSECVKCNGTQKVHYQTPRGKDMTEVCVCYDSRTRHYKTEEMVAWSADHRNRKLMVWHKPVRTLDEDDRWDTIVLKNPEGVSLEDRMDDYHSYGFTTEAAAQEVADALNAKPQDTEEDEW